MELASTPRCVCHMKGMEVPSVKPLGQAPMGMEGASCGEHERESCLRTGLEGTFMPFVLPCLKSLKSSEGGEGSFVEVGGGVTLRFDPKRPFADLSEEAAFPAIIASFAQRSDGSDGSDGSFSPGGLVRGDHIARLSARFHAVKADDTPSFPFGLTA